MRSIITKFALAAVIAFAAAGCSKKDDVETRADFDTVNAMTDDSKLEWTVTHYPGTLQNHGVTSTVYTATRPPKGILKTGTVAIAFYKPDGVRSVSYLFRNAEGTTTSIMALSEGRCVEGFDSSCDSLTAAEWGMEFDRAEAFALKRAKTPDTLH